MMQHFASVYELKYLKSQKMACCLVWPNDCHSKNYIATGHGGRDITWASVSTSFFYAAIWYQHFKERAAVGLTQNQAHHYLRRYQGPA